MTRGAPRTRPPRTFADRAFDPLWAIWCRETRRDETQRATVEDLRRFFAWWSDALADVAS